MSQIEAEWWYICGFNASGNQAFSHAAFRWNGGWRVHQTTYNFGLKFRSVKVGESPDGFRGPLFNAAPIERNTWGTHRIPRAAGRFYEVCPFAKATVTFHGFSGGIYEVWYEHEFGPILLENGWDWMALKRGEFAWLSYRVGDEYLSYRFCRDGTMATPAEIPKICWVTPVDRDIYDPAFDVQYEEYPIMGDGYEGFKELVQPRSLQRVPYAPVDVKLKEYALGEPNATALLLALYKASQLADDIADCDEKPDRVADVIRVLGVEMPRNPFFRAHADVLTATLAQVIDCWEWSNEYEDDLDKTKRVLAYSMKDAAIMYIRQVAFLVGGHEHAKRVLDDAIQFFHGPGGVEPFEVTR